LKHLSSGRNREHSLSSGERKGNSPNQPSVIGGSRFWAGVVVVDVGDLPDPTGVTKSIVSRTRQERRATEGDSPVGEASDLQVSHLSTTWKFSHVGTRADHRPRLNTLGDR